MRYIITENRSDYLFVMKYLISERQLNLIFERKEEIQVYVEKLIDSQDTEFERQFMGGTKQIHGPIL